MDDKMLQLQHPDVYDTGEVCPECGEHIFAAKIDIGGRLVEFKKPCACRDAEIKAEDAAKKARDREKARQRRLEWAEIPDLFYGATLKGYRRIPGTEQAFEAVKEYLLNRKDNFRAGRGLILMDAVGCGKTHLGCAILNCALEDGYRAAY